MLFDIFNLLLQSAASLLAFCLLLRALMQWVRLHPKNPLAPFVFAMTDWLVRPLRRFVPGFGGVDWASLLGALLVAALLNIALLSVKWLLASEASTVLSLGRVVVAFGIPAAFLWLFTKAVYLIMTIVLVQAVLSWVNPSSPISTVLNDLCRPFIAPLRRFIPTIGNVDLSPLALILVLQILMMIVQQLTASWVSF